MKTIIHNLHAYDKKRAHREGKLIKKYLLVGLGMNYYYGLWLADPIVGLIVAGYLMKEGFGILREANE